MRRNNLQRLFCIAVWITLLFTIGGAVVAESQPYGWNPGGWLVARKFTLWYGGALFHSELDMDGNAVYLDEDQDTYLDASTDDTLDVYLSGAKDFTFTANAFTAQLGSSIVGPLDANGNPITLDADADTTITADTDDQIDIALAGDDYVIIKDNPAATESTSAIVEITGTSPAYTTGTNAMYWLNVDMLPTAATSGTNTLVGVEIDNVSGVVTATEIGLRVGTGFDIGVDVSGTKIDLDADNDTSITADTDDQIDVEVAGADDFRITANTFTALAGSNVTLADGNLSVSGKLISPLESVITVTNGTAFTPTGRIQEIAAAGEVTPTVTVGSDGEEVILINTGSNTINIADSGTMKLDSAMAMDQDDTLHLVCDGTNWYRVSSSAN